MKRRSMAMAGFFLDTGRPRRAIDQLKQVLGTDPDDADAHGLLAVALLQDRRRHAAEAEARLAMALEPESVQALRAFVLVQVHLDRPGEAQPALELLQALQPESADTWMLSAHAVRVRGERQAAWEALQRALALAPDDPDVLAAVSRHMLWNNRLVEARRYAMEAMSASAQSSEAREALAWVLLREGQVEEARQLVVSLLRDHPGSQSALGLMASVKARQSPFLGLWWRWNVRMVAMGNQAVVVLLGVFVLYQLGRLALGDLGHEDLMGLLEITWLGLCAYTWFAPAVFKNMLDKELAQVKLREDF